MSSSSDLFKELFTREFSNLINSGVDKQAAAVQALQVAQRSLTTSQQFPQENSNSNNNSSSNGSSVLTSSNGGKSSESDADPTREEDNDVHRKGKVAAAVNGTISSTKSTSQVVKLAPLKAIPQVIVPPAVELLELKKLLSECEASNNYSPLIRFIGSSFASAEALNLSFSMNNRLTQEQSLTLEGKMDVVADENNGSSSSSGSHRKGSGDGMVTDCGHDASLDIDIDIAAVSEAFALLFACGHEGVRNSLGHALEGLGYSMQTQHGTQTCTTPNSLKHLLVVLEHPEILDPRLEITCRNLLVGIDRLPSRSKKLFARWISRNADQTRFRKYLSTFRQFMTLRLYQGSVDDARLATRALALLHTVSDMYQVPLGEFYNDALNDEYMQSRDGVRLEYRHWLKDKQAMELRRKELRVVALEKECADAVVKLEAASSSAAAAVDQLESANAAAMAALNALANRRSSGASDSGEGNRNSSSSSSSGGGGMDISIGGDGSSSGGGGGVTMDVVADEGQGGPVSDAQVSAIRRLQAEAEEQLASARAMAVSVAASSPPPPSSSSSSSSSSQSSSQSLMETQGAKGIVAAAASSSSSSSTSSEGNDESDEKNDPLDRPRYAPLEQNLVSFISYPFVLSPATKAAILECDAALQMRRGVQQEAQMAMSRGEETITPYFVLRVSRANIVLDTLSQVMLYEEADFKKPLKVVFDHEEGVDAGGVKKEYFQVMMRLLLDPNYGMFKSVPESRRLWFNSDSLESAQEFELVGLLVGVAIYNSVILDLRLPRVVYRKLKRLPSSLSDLADLQPELARGLQQLLDFEGDVQATFGACFQISYEVFGQVRTVDLVPDGGSVPVTALNRREYVRLYVQYTLDLSVAPQFEAFQKGFHKVCGGDALDLFEAEELELLICGNPVLNFQDLEKGATYEDGYLASSKSVIHLWSVLHSFNEEEKRQFLCFVSGSDRSPIDGLSKLALVVSRNGDEDHRLPSAHTCFNHLLLPDYSSSEVLKERLMFAMTQSEGFGLR